MYHRGDYSRPSFAVTVPGLLTNEGGDCPEGKQIIEFLTVANYQRFLQLKLSDARAYRARKREILDSILDVMERRLRARASRSAVFQDDRQSDDQRALLR